MEISVLKESLNIEVENGNVKHNLQVLKGAIEKRKEELKQTVYSGTEKEQLAMIKADRAAINKFTEGCAKQKTAVRKALLKPFEGFEAEINEIIETSKVLYADLDTLAKELEEKQREKRRTEIRQFYDEIASDVGDFKDDLYRMVYDTSWENATSTMKAYKEGLSKAVEAYTSGITSITAMICDDDIKERAKKQFCVSLNLAETLLFINNEQNQRAEEKRRLQAAIEAEKQRMEREKLEAIEAERQKMEQEKLAAIEAEKQKMEREKLEAIEAEQQKIEQAQVVVAEEKKKATENRIVVSFNASDWKKIEEYCYENGIFFVRN